MLTELSLKFLKDLKKNNNKEWFDANRNKYETTKEHLAALVTKVIEKHSKKDASIAWLTAKDCMYRINRDVRFSKDKSPYKTNIGAYISKGGKKSFHAGYYFHLEPGKSFVGGGLWQPETEMLKKVRQEIDYNFDDFKKIVEGKKFKAEYGELTRNENTVLQREPKGYAKENPAIEFIKLKSWLALQPLTDAEITSKALPEKILNAFEILQPLIEFFNVAMEA